LSTVVVAICGGNESIGTPSDGTVTNVKVHSSAAIATSKLSGAVTSIPSHGLGALATLATVGTTQIDNDSVTGAKLNPALVAGDVIYADGTDTINRLAKPATPAGEVLTFATSATAPSWVAPAASGLATGSNQVAQAWVNFNGSSGSPVLYDSYNISSVGDNGTGDWTVNFTSAFADENFCSVTNTCDPNHNASLLIAHSAGVGVNRSTSSERILCQYVAGSASDGDAFVSYIAFGDV
jgi:hypothetical protein